MKFNYEKLEVYQLSLKLIEKIYKLSKKFPKEELYCLVSQIKRAVTSVNINIAEGSSRKTKNDFKRFVRISIGSLLEVDAILKIALRLRYLDNKDYLNIDKLIEKLFFKLIGLYKFLDR